MKQGLFPPSLLSGENIWADQYNDDLNLDTSEVDNDNSVLDEVET